MIGPAVFPGLPRALGLNNLAECGLYGGKWRWAVFCFSRPVALAFSAGALPIRLASCGLRARASRGLSGTVTKAPLRETAVA